MIVTESALTNTDLLANRFGVVSRMADDLAHEIKNPLHSMAINLEVMRRRIAAGDGGAAADRAGVVDAELRRVNELTGLLLRLIRPDADAPPVADVDATLGEIVPLIAARARLARVRFDYRPIGGPARAAVPATPLKFAVLNAVEEVFDFARTAGGELRLAGVTGPLAIRVDAVLPAGAVIAAKTTAQGAMGGIAGMPYARAILSAAGGAAERHDAAGTVSIRLLLPLAAPA